MHWLENLYTNIAGIVIDKNGMMKIGVRLVSLQVELIELKRDV